MGRDVSHRSLLIFVIDELGPFGLGQVIKEHIGFSRHKTADSCFSLVATQPPQPQNMSCNSKFPLTCLRRMSIRS